MAIYKNTPPIITNGLILNLDAANVKSYPGTGTTWSDLSGNNNTGTLTNNTYSTLGGGNIAFNGSNSVVGLGDNDLFSFTSGGGVDLPFSVSCWVRLTAYGSGVSAFSMFVAKSQYNGAAWIREWAFGQVNATGLVFNIFNPDTSGTTYIGRLVGSPLSLNVWYHFAATYSGSKTTSGINLYINGVLQSTATNVSGGTYTGMGNTATTVELGRQYSAGATDNGYFSGNISNVLIYKNKVLSASEVLQNYNALKSRYNLS